MMLVVRLRMTHITIKVPYNGKDVDVIVDDDIAFGKLSSIIKKMVKVEDVLNGVLKPDLDTFLNELVPAVVVSAPWDIKQKGWFSNLGHKTARPLIVKVVEMYPLEDYLRDIMAGMTGQKKDET